MGKTYLEPVTIINSLETCDFNDVSIRNSFLLYRNVTSQYNDPQTLDAVRKLVPDDIQKDSLESLLKWFKSFMHWMPANLVCGNCSSGTNNPNDAGFMQRRIEIGDSWKMPKTEVYTCNFCGAIQYFPRYNEVLKIGKVRTGRCGEWSILFGAVLNSLSFQSRIVQDYLDHCWNEVMLDGRWIHVDSTLDYPISLDHPYYYEQNWKKQYLYVLSFSSDQIEDVTQRYTQDWKSVLLRRQNLQETGSSTRLGSISYLQDLYYSIRVS